MYFNRQVRHDDFFYDIQIPTVRFYQKGIEPSNKH